MQKVLNSTDISYVEGADIEYIIESKIRAYEKRYKTKVKYILLYGVIGNYKGNFNGGKLVYGTASDVLNAFSRGYNVSMYINPKDNTYVIQAKHHDGKHLLKIHFVTEAKVNALGINLRFANNPNELERWQKYLNPLKH